MTSRRELTTTVAVGVAAAALVFASSAQPWAVVSATDALGTVREVGPQGRQMAPHVAALALVALAASVAVAFIRRSARMAAGAAILLAGAGLAVASIAAGRDPGGGSTAALEDITGLAGTSARDSVIEASSTPWPWVAATAGVLLCLVGVAVLARSRRWGAPSSRYEAPAAGEHRARDGAAGANASPDRAVGDDALGDGAWAALSRGEDPTLDDRMPATKEERT